MNPVINVMTIIPIRYPTAVNGPKNIVKNTHNITYHEMDSENIINPLKNPKCSVSKPDINALSFVIILMNVIGIRKNMRISLGN